MNGAQVTSTAPYSLEQNGFVEHTTPIKRKFDDRALKVRYIRTTQDGQFLMLVVKPMKTRLIRTTEFVLPPTINYEKTEGNHLDKDRAADGEDLDSNYTEK